MLVDPLALPTRKPCKLDQHRAGISIGPARTKRGFSASIKILKWFENGEAGITWASSHGDDSVILGPRFNRALQAFRRV
ncbi:MAG TPA: hypothetical protein VMJ32_16860 [Pirellulales bacterium]|nr:hypothetical protein [Pirellulales bacterium]